LFQHLTGQIIQAIFKRVTLSAWDAETSSA
jgi:hypothetical protein